jgi:hypothetical protein
VTDHTNDGITSANQAIDVSWKWLTVTKTYSNVGDNPRLFGMLGKQTKHVRSLS